jgi:hypothetical protein
LLTFLPCKYEDPDEGKDRLFMRSEHNRLLLSPFVFFIKGGQVQISSADANLIWVAPECHDMGRHACPCQGALGQNVYFSKR